MFDKSTCMYNYVLNALVVYHLCCNDFEKKLQIQIHAKRDTEGKISKNTTRVK